MGEIARHMEQEIGQPIWHFNIARMLHNVGLLAQLSVWCVLLTPVHQRRHSLWCQEHQNWTDNWVEYSLWMRADLVWVAILDAYISGESREHTITPTNIIKRGHFSGCRVLIWEGVMLGTWTNLHIFEGGSIAKACYCNEVFLPYVHLLGVLWVLSSISWTTILHLIAQLSESADIECMDWPI